ncbi:MAG: flagellar basal body rod protein FlgC [Planctomycetota bacterium]|jgi:flagellar basal-body rod protein FlgC
MNVDSNFGTVDISISGLRAQNKNMQLISSNVANAQSQDDGTGQPYRRVEAALKAAENGGVVFDEIKIDNSDFQKILKPGDPSADAQGYVSMPNVNVPIEMMNLNAAVRSYKANAAVLKRYQQMVETSLELLK